MHILAEFSSYSAVNRVRRGNHVGTECAVPKLAAKLLSAMLHPLWLYSHHPELAASHLHQPLGSWPCLGTGACCAGVPHNECQRILDASKMTCSIGRRPCYTQALLGGRPLLLCPASPSLHTGGGWAGQWLPRLLCLACDTAPMVLATLGIHCTTWQFTCSSAFRRIALHSWQAAKATVAATWLPKVCSRGV